MAWFLHICASTREIWAGKLDLALSCQVRLHAIELQMAPIRSAIHILFPDYLAVVKDGKTLSELEHLNLAARQMLDQLAWWTAALKVAREQSSRQAA